MAKKKVSGVRLYDLRKRDYPRERGDTFRSLQVFECWVCGAITNRVIMGGSLGYGIRAVCPSSSECWHHKLEENIEWLYKSYPPIDTVDLQKKIDKMKIENQKNVKNDIEGNPDMTLRRCVTDTLSWKHGSPCAHRTRMR